jgi:hypothetical protein
MWREGERLGGLRPSLMQMRCQRNRAASSPPGSDSDRTEGERHRLIFGNLIPGFVS